LKREGWVCPLSRGFFLALDVQHQEWGRLDPTWFVDEWARYYGTGYYVGGLSAAAHHGAAHQRAMQFQVFADRQLRSVKSDRLHMLVMYKKRISDEMWEQRKSPAGYFRVATPEMTAYDIMAYRRCCPSLDHAATVYVELGETLSAEALAGLLQPGRNVSVLQRVGWLLDYVGWQERSGLLHDALSKRRLQWRPLDPRMATAGERDSRWKLIVNSDVQPDIER
jgi:predicted transcriptional regulator of viral defense system